MTSPFGVRQEWTYHVRTKNLCTQWPQKTDSIPRKYFYDPKVTTNTNLLVKIPSISIFCQMEKYLPFWGAGSVGGGREPLREVGMSIAGWGFRSPRKLWCCLSFSYTMSIHLCSLIWEWECQRKSDWKIANLSSSKLPYFAMKILGGPGKIFPLGGPKILGGPRNSGGT